MLHTNTIPQIVGKNDVTHGDNLSTRDLFSRTIWTNKSNCISQRLNKNSTGGTCMLKSLNAQTHGKILKSTCFLY